MTSRSIPFTSFATEKEKARVEQRKEGRTFRESWLLFALNEINPVFFQLQADNYEQMWKSKWYRRKVTTNRFSLEKILVKD